MSEDKKKFLNLDIMIRDDVPKGTILLVPPRRIVNKKRESIEDWAKRGVRIKND